jgi:hypothetical protein
MKVDGGIMIRERDWKLFMEIRMRWRGSGFSSRDSRKF